MNCEVVIGEVYSIALDVNILFAVVRLVCEFPISCSDAVVVLLEP